MGQDANSALASGTCPGSSLGWVSLNQQVVTLVLTLRILDLKGLSCPDFVMPRSRVFFPEADFLEI